MVTMRKNFVETARNGITRANFSEGECADKTDNGSGDPGEKKNFRQHRFRCDFSWRAKNSHTDDESDNDYRKIKEAELWFYCRFFQGISCWLRINF